MYKYESYGFNLTLKSRILSLFTYFILFGIEVLIVFFTHLGKFDNTGYWPYIFMIMILALFFILIFRYDIKISIHNHKIKKYIKNNISLPSGYVSEYFLAKDTDNKKYQVVFIAYNQLNEGRTNFLYSTQFLNLCVDRFGDILYRKNNTYKLSNYLVDINEKNTDIKNLEINELSFYCKNKKFSTMKSNLFSSLFYSIFIKLLLFAILTVILTLTLEFINGVLVSTIAIFGIDKLLTWLMGIGNVQIRNVSNYESEYTILNVKNEEYIVRTNDVKFLYKDFSDNERNTR